MRTLLTALALLIPVGIWGAHGASASFDGVTDVIDPPNIVSTQFFGGIADGESAMTWAAWIYVPTFDATNYYVTHGFFDTTTTAFSVYMINGTGPTDAGDVRFGGRSQQADGWQGGPNPTDTLDDGVWYFVVVRVDYANDEVDIDMDGTKYSAAVTFGSTTYANSGTPSFTEVIGDGNGQNPFAGNMSHIRIWNRELTDEEVAEAEYCMDRPANGLQVHYPLWSVANIVDISGNQANATNSGATVDSDGPPTSWCGGG